jgi:hypothetical protein
MIDPYDNEESLAIQQGWMDVYNRYMPVVNEALSKIYPYDESQYSSAKSWEKAVQARAFDTLRSLLPVGTGTLLSWHTNLRQARDHLRHLKSHPLKEIREVAGCVFESLHSRYGNSFNGEEMSEDSERYRDRDAYAVRNSLKNHVLIPDEALKDLSPEETQRLEQGEVIIDDFYVNIDAANDREAEAFDRPRGAPLSRRLMKYGSYNLSFLLDFGSYRDIQRHRNGYCPVPLVGGRFGFHKWYLDELQTILPAEQFAALKGEIDALLKRIDKLTVPGQQRDPLKDQYLYPMGMACLCQLSYCIPQMVYVSELRSGKTVHPSLRVVSHQMARQLQQRHPDLKLYVDYDEDSWTAKRGDQDIVERKKAG